MKNFKTLLTLVLLFITLTIVACSPKPPPVSQSQFNAARQEALDAEAATQALQREKSELEAELYARGILRDVLLEMIEEME